MKAAIVIEMDNDAFAGANCGNELARILRQMAKKVDGFNEVECRLFEVKVMDINGNKVGRLEIDR